MWIETHDPGIERRPRRSASERRAARQQAAELEALLDRARDAGLWPRVTEIIQEPGTNVRMAAEQALEEAGLR